MEYISAFFISFFFGVYFQNPKRTLISAGLTGVIGWSVFEILYSFESELFSVLMASVIIAILSEIFARIHKTPVTVFIIVGFIPLVPGVRAYNTILEFSRGNLDKGLELTIETFFIACAIALGISIISSIARILKEQKIV
ncbi:threonine/serine exporter family protein [Natranaerobius trueperi]|nr:threonine/serine exporter family protein [Natranaerobius trueperi]